MSWFATVSLAALLLAPLNARAQGPNGSRSTRSAAETVRQNQPDFLFGRPATALGLRFQWTRPRADSEVYDFLTDVLTLSTRDFDAPGLAVDVAFPITSRLDAQGGFDFGHTTAMSEDRKFLEEINGERIPIQQETTMTHVNLAGSLEMALAPRGRAIGQYAWIPASVTPYVGGGAGLLYYRLSQNGDFVDTFDPELPIFSAQLSSDGWTLSSHVFGGVDVKLTRRVLLSAELRYLWADATLGPDYVDFDPIDLAGLRITGGIQLLF